MAECKFSGLTCDGQPCGQCSIQKAYNAGRRSMQDEIELRNLREWTAGADQREHNREVNEE